MTMKLRAYIKKCGSVRLASSQLKTPVSLLADMALGCLSTPAYIEAAIDRALKPIAEDNEKAWLRRNPGSGRAALAEFMAWKGVDLAGAAELLRVSPTYLRQQASLRDPTGRVIFKVRQALTHQGEPTLDPTPVLAQIRKVVDALPKPVARSSAKKRAEIEAHNECVRAAREEYVPLAPQGDDADARRAAARAKLAVAKARQG